MTSTTQLLKDLPLFARLGEAALAAVAERTVVRSFPENAVLFRRGEPCQGLYVVIEGRIRVYRASRDGREQVLHTQGPGQPLAEVPLFDGGAYPASARAVADSRVLFLPLGEFQWLYRNHPEIADSVIRELGRRLRKMVGLVEKISLKDVAARVAASLLEYAGGAGDLRDGVGFVLPRTQEELAAELATTRESVARALARLRAEGIIEQNGSRVRIRSIARLEAVSLGD
ncbi:MAG TPA: Crp/Fnr family transcriptional regulator [Longimicrobiaceae bacterium]|nr:Crp/Fnr family transcriptional regulator [Longimicrobiaceae bacterium]